MGNNNYLAPVADERRGLLDPEASGEIYRRLLDYIRTPDTSLSGAWGPPRVPPVYQHQNDLVDEDGQILHRSDLAFIVGLSAIRKRDGQDFHFMVRIPPERKGDWEVILEFFTVLRVTFEGYTDCNCKGNRVCAAHALGPKPLGPKHPASQ